MLRWCYILPSAEIWFVSTNITYKSLQCTWKDGVVHHLLFQLTKQNIFSFARLWGSVPTHVSVLGYHDASMSNFSNWSIGTRNWKRVTPLRYVVISTLYCSIFLACRFNVVLKLSHVHCNLAFLHVLSLLGFASDGWMKIDDNCAGLSCLLLADRPISSMEALSHIELRDEAYPMETHWLGIIQF